MPAPTDVYLQELVARLDNEDTQGVTMSGSFARGEGGPYSDVDLLIYIRQGPTGEFGMPHLEFIDGFLVSTMKTTLEREYAGLKDPVRAIWVIPALRQERILLDKDGAIAILEETARNLVWESLQAAANDFASSCLAATAEEVCKILDGLARGNESKTLHAIWSLTQNLADALLVRSGTLIPTENAFMDLVQATAGRNSGWTHQFRLAVGLDSIPQGKPAFIGLGMAGIALYRETALLLKPVLKPEDSRVVEWMLGIMTQAGYG